MDVQLEVRPWTKDAKPEQVQALQGLFAELYAHMATTGLSHPLVADGAQQWYAGMMPLLGRMTFIHGAWQDERLVGFVAGMFRALPPYVGGARIGALTHIHVHHDVRLGAVGRTLFHALCTDFRAGQATLLEVDVLTGNAAGRAFFERMGCVAHHTILHRTL